MAPKAPLYCYSRRSSLIEPTYLGASVLTKTSTVNCFNKRLPYNLFDVCLKIVQPWDECLPLP